MSQLAKNIRDFLLDKSSAAQMLPGGIHPDIAPAGAVMPYAVTSGTSITHVRDLSGRLEYLLERIDVAVCAKTRAECERALWWMEVELTPPSWKDGFGDKVFWWRVDEHGDISEMLVDGDDDTVRLARVGVIGATRPEGFIIKHRS